MKKLLGIIAVGAIAFGVVTSAASAIGGLGSVAAPAQGAITITGLGCTATGSASLTYSDSSYTDGTTVVSVQQPASCSGTVGSWVVSGAYPGSAAISGSDLVVSFSPAPTLSSFSAGSIVVTALP